MVTRQGKGMRCSCGQPGVYELPRRDLPYCDNCLRVLIARCIRLEAGKEPIQLRPQSGYFFEALKAACEVAKRQIIFEEQGAVAGCAEIAAATRLRREFGESELPEIFPTSITAEELQMFFKPPGPVILDALTAELIAFDHAYPGTTRSILKSLPPKPR